MESSIDAVKKEFPEDAKENIETARLCIKEFKKRSTISRRELISKPAETEESDDKTSSLTDEQLLENFEKIWKRQFIFLSFLRPSILILFHALLLNFGFVFRGLAWVLGNSWKQRFCNTFYVKSQIPRAYWLNVFCILVHFSRTRS